MRYRGRAGAELGLGLDYSEYRGQGLAGFELKITMAGAGVKPGFIKKKLEVRFSKTKIENCVLIS